MTLHMWPFWMEMEYYSADYFKYVTMYKMHYRCLCVPSMCFIDAPNNMSVQGVCEPRP